MGSRGWQQGEVPGLLEGVWEQAVRDILGEEGLEQAVRGDCQRIPG